MIFKSIEDFQQINNSVSSNGQNDHPPPVMQSKNSAKTAGIPQNFKAAKLHEPIQSLAIELLIDLACSGNIETQSINISAMNSNDCDGQNTR